jgi:hypothetical protein
MRPPEFLMVRTEDAGRVGALGAYILALVRYVTTLPGETNGRRIVDGEMWWRASHDDIGQALGGGVSRRTVSSTVRKLQDTGDLLAISTQDFYGDRAQAYRSSDQPLARSDQGSDVPLADIADRSAEIAKQVGRMCQARRQNLPSTPADIADLPLFGELEEINEEGEEKTEPAAPGPLDAEPVPNHGDAAPPPDSSEENPKPLDVENVEPVSRELVAQRVDGMDAIVHGEVVDDDPDPEPQAYCDRHMPDGTDRPCGACGGRRRAHEKWEQRQPSLGLLQKPSKFRAWAELATEERAREQAQSDTAGKQPTFGPRHRQPAPAPEPPAWILGPYGPRCPRHGHHKVSPAECTRCQDAALAAQESA